MTAAHTLATPNGPRTVDATEPAPGLHVFEAPADLAPGAAHRWFLAHHEGHVLATFETSTAATTAASKVAPLADWTRNVMTAANEISLGGRVEELMGLLQAGGVNA